MDLQSLGDKAVTSRNACPPDNLRAYSPQISEVSRCQPDTSGLARGVRPRRELTQASPCSVRDRLADSCFDVPVESQSRDESLK